MPKQDIPFPECIELLKEAEYGYLAMSAYNQPYVIPVNYYYDDSEKIYIHTGPEGQKIDYLSFNPSVCLAVSEAGPKAWKGSKPCGYTYPFWSVLVYGTVRIIKEGPEKKAALEKIIEKYRETETDPLTEADLKKVVILEIDFKEVFGRRNIVTEESDAGEFLKIAVLENEFEAQMLEGTLKEQGLPFEIRSYHDLAYDGIFQFQRGWGAVYAPAAVKKEIMEILSDLRKNRPE